MAEDYVSLSVKTESDYKNYTGGSDPIARAQILSVFKSMEQLGGTAEALKKGLFYGKELQEHQLAAINALQLRVHPEGAPEFSFPDPSARRVTHGLMGLVSETGEIAELVLQLLGVPGYVEGSENESPETWKKALLKEMGDLFWYAAIVCHVMGWSFEDVMKANLAKLQGKGGRYEKGDGTVGFTQAGAIERNTEAEDAAVAAAMRGDKPKEDTASDTDPAAQEKAMLADQAKEAALVAEATATKANTGKPPKEEKDKVKNK
jgi:NTP pyrophosphatase (non-canonical NTP hydrolase)